MSSIGKKIDKFGEMVIYLFIFSIFIDSKLTLKIGYILQMLSILKIILDWKNISITKFRGKEIYTSFFIILILGICFNFLSTQHDGVHQFINRNLKFLIGIMFLLFIDNSKKIERVKYVLLFSAFVLGLAIIFQLPFIHLDIIRQRGVLVLGLSFTLGYLFEMVREGFFTNWKKITVYIFIVIILLEAIAILNSRMAFLTIVGVIFIYLLYLLFTKHYSYKFVIILLCCSLFSLGFYLCTNKSYTERVSTSFQTKNNTSNVYRLIMWKGCILAFLDSPIIGVGSSTQDIGPYISAAAEEYQEQEQISKDFVEEKNFQEAHSIYFNFLSQTGLLILGYMFLFFIQIPRRFLRNKQSKTVIASFLGIMSFCIYGLTWSIWGFYGVIQKLFQILIALLIVSGEESDEE